MAFPDFDLTKINTFLLTLAACVSAFAAWQQTLINKRLKNINDFAAVAVSPESGHVKIHNVGKINLYLHAYQYANEIKLYNDERLLSVGTGDTVFYWLPAPSWKHFTNHNLEVTLFLSDEFGKKITARFGGEITSGDEHNFQYVIWSLRTKEENWSLK